MVDYQLKHDVQDNPDGEQGADGLRSASQQFTSTSRIEEQTEQVGWVSRLGIDPASAHPKQDGERRLQDEAETSWPCESPRQFLQELP